MRRCLGTFCILAHLQAEASSNRPCRRLHLHLLCLQGFLIVISLLTLCTAFVAANWLRGAAASKQQQQQQLEMWQTCTESQPPPQQQTSWQDEQEWHDCTPMPSWQQQLRGDGLILLLLTCDVLLLWSDAALMASLSHPALFSDAALHYPLMVLPELLVAVMWAMPTVTARIALGARYNEWRQLQVLQGRGAKDMTKGSGKLSDAGSADAVDAEALADGSSGDLVKSSAV
jgi:hypothetical protein